MHAIIAAHVTHRTAATSTDCLATAKHAGTSEALQEYCIRAVSGHIRRASRPPGIQPGSQTDLAPPERQHTHRQPLLRWAQVDVGHKQPSTVIPIWRQQAGGINGVRTYLPGCTLCQSVVTGTSMQHQQATRTCLARACQRTVTALLTVQCQSL
jgi:hypothetical protein